MPPIFGRAVFILAALVAGVAPREASASNADAPTYADRPGRDVEDIERTFSLMLDPLAIATGVYGGDIDIVLGRHLAMSLECDIYGLASGATATALGAGLLFYPGSALRGFYLEPRIAYARPFSEGLFRFDWSSDALGFGATAGWQWLWDYGFTMRLGGGGMYFLDDSGRSSGAVAIGRPQFVLDGSLGWAF